MPIQVEWMSRSHIQTETSSCQLLDAYWNLFSITHVRVTMRVVLFTIFLMSISFCFGQSEFLGLSAQWDDRLDAWEVLYYDPEGEENAIELSQVWPLRTDWESWRLQGDDITGDISTQWRGDLTRWNIKIGEERLEIRQRWRNAPNQWEIVSDRGRSLLRTQLTNNANVWICSLEEGDFAMYTMYDGDPRDWVIEDYIIDSLSDTEKLAMIFIALFQSIPK